MATKVTTIRDAIAKGQLKKAQKVGIQISLSHQGASGTTLWAMSDPSSVTMHKDQGTVNEYEMRVFAIPRQTGFTGSISENDEITVSTTGLDISANVYVVDHWDIESYGAVYQVAAWRGTIRRANP